MEVKVRILSKCLLSVFILLLFNFALAAEPELITEIAIQGEAVHGDLLHGKLNLSSPQGFRILTAAGRAAFKAQLLANQGVVFSQDGEYFGITSYSTEVSPGILAAEKFELYSSDGQMLWEIENPTVSEFLISNGAKLVLGISSIEGSSQSRVVIYNRNGEMVSDTLIGLTSGTSFSFNGNHVLINTAQDGLLLFNQTGKLTNRFGAGDRFAISADGKNVATISGRNLKLYVAGKPVVELEEIAPFSRGMAFSPESKHLGVIDKKKLYLIEVETGKLLWQHALEQPELSFISLDVSRNAERIIAGLDFDKGTDVPAAERHTQGSVFIFDKEGKQIWQKDLAYTLWGAMFPLVKTSEEGTRFSVTTREKVYLYQSNQSEK
jgi:outer membrane protein assembly factor BamB